MKKKYIVTLSDEERGALRAMITAGKASARKLTHARILLKAERRKKHREWEDTRIAGALGRWMWPSRPSKRCASGSLRKAWRRRWCPDRRDASTRASWTARRRPI